MVVISPYKQSVRRLKKRPPEGGRLFMHMLLRGAITWARLKPAMNHTPARNVFAAATMFLSAGITSSH
jgi:hypothetical protein